MSGSPNELERTFALPRTAASDVEQFQAQYHAAENLIRKCLAAHEATAQLLQDVTQAVKDVEGGDAIAVDNEEHFETINAGFVTSLKANKLLSLDLQALKSTARYATSHIYAPGQDAKEIVDAGETVLSLDEKFKETCPNADEFWSQALAASDYSNQETAAYVKFRNAAAFGSAAPDTTLTLVEVQNGLAAAGDEFDDIMVGRTVRSYKCPLTGEYLENPVRAPCGHHFTRSALVDYINLKQAETRVPFAPCPVAGCLKEFGLNDVVADHRIEAKVKAAKEHERSQTQSFRSNVASI